MMSASIRAALVAALNAQSSITAITTVFVPGNAPERESYPQIVYDLKSNNSDRHYGGTSGLVQASLDIRCIDRTSAGSEALATLVEDYLDSLSGTFGGVTVQRFFVESATDETFTIGEDESTTLYARLLPVEAWYDAV